MGVLRLLAATEMWVVDHRATMPRESPGGAEAQSSKMNPGGSRVAEELGMRLAAIQHTGVDTRLVEVQVYVLLKRSSQAASETSRDGDRGVFNSVSAVSLLIVSACQATIYIFDSSQVTGPSHAFAAWT